MGSKKFVHKSVVKRQKIVHKNVIECKKIPHKNVINERYTFPCHKSAACGKKLDGLIHREKGWLVRTTLFKIVIGFILKFKTQSQ